MDTVSVVIEFGALPKRVVCSDFRHSYVDFGLRGRPRPTVRVFVTATAESILYTHTHECGAATVRF